MNINRRLYVAVMNSGVFLVSNWRVPHKSAISVRIGSKSEVARYWPGIRRVQIGQVANMGVHITRIMNK